MHPPTAAAAARPALAAHPPPAPCPLAVFLPPPSDLAALYAQEGRRLVSDAFCSELIAAAAEGPRASDRFAAVTAAAVAGLAGSVQAAEVVANFLDRCDSLCCLRVVLCTLSLV